MGVFDVAKHAANADRGELLIISHQPDTPTPSDHELHGAVEGKGVGHSGFIDYHQGRRADPRSPIRQIMVLQRPGELGEGVAADSGVLGEDGGRGGRRGEAEHLTAVLGPGHREGAHSCCFPRAGGGDRELHTCSGGTHLADQCRLPGIECSTVRRYLQQR